ncbi:MAG: hypothetical protein V1787_00555 [Candidatus Micrarchaeota archaeon]
MELWERYPFLSEARRRLKQEGVESVTGEEVESAERQVLETLQGGPRPPKDAKGYVLARLLLAAGGDSNAMQRYGEAEARRYMLQIETAGVQEYEAVAKDFFPGLQTDAQGGGYSIALLDYLSAGTTLADEAVEEGRVHVGRTALSRLLAQAIAQRITQVRADAKALPKEIRDAGRRLSAALPRPAVSLQTYAGKYLGLPAVQALLQGVGEGKRYYASVTVAIACLKDGLQREQAAEVMRTFAKNCRRSTHDFTEKEALASMEWVYKHPTINFSVKTLRDQQIVDEQSLAKTAEMLRRRRKTIRKA